MQEFDPSRPLKRHRAEYFCQIVASSPTMPWAKQMEKAGYAAHYQNYTRLKQRPANKARIEWLRGQIAARVVEKTADHEAVTREEVVAGLRNIVKLGLEKDRNGRRDLSSAQRAYQDLGKSIGIFTERKIIETEGMEFDDMTEEQVQEHIVGLLGHLDPNKVRAIVGKALDPGAEREVPEVAPDESDQDLQAVPEAVGVPPTRH